MMITGVGVDIVPIEKFAREINRNGFLDQILTEEEKMRAPEGEQKDVFYARIFATKEAVLKALGCGLQSGFRWRDISVVEGPEVHLSGWLRSVAEKLSISRIHVSYSSSNTHAVAFVLFESNNPGVTA